MIVTKLMDRGVPRRSRAAPEHGHLRSYRDEGNRLVYRLCYPDKTTDPIPGWMLLMPQCGDVGERTAIYFGFERAGGGASDPLVAQAWEVELPPRRT